MAKISSKNNDFLKEAKKKSSAQIYSIILDLVNEDREDLAEEVMKVDYLLEYTSSCIKLKEIRDGKEALEKARRRIDKIKNEGGDVSYLEYLYEGIEKKCK